jgi:ABC-type multidrug transport system permease subunit
MKHIWMVVAILSLLAGIHKTWRFGLQESYLFFIFAFIAFIMYLIRKNMGKPKKL